MNENTRTNYINTLCTKINERLTPAASARHTLVEKHNDQVLDAITFDIPDVNISPIVYIHSILDEMPDVDTAADTIVEMFKNSSAPNIDIDSLVTHLNNKYWIKDHVLPRLTASVADDVISIPFMNMYISFYIEVMDNGTITLRNNHTDLTTEQLLYWAKKNAFTNYNFKGMLETLREMSPNIAEFLYNDDEEQMYILSSKKGFFGASAIIDDNILATIAHKLNSNLYILPSSIHECIIVKADNTMDKEILKEIVRSVNETKVCANDYLSDSVYLFIKDRSHLQYA